MKLTMENKVKSYNNPCMSKGREMRNILLHHLNMLEDKEILSEIPLQETEFESDTNKHITINRNRLSRFKTSKKSLANLVNRKLPENNEIVLEGMELRTEKPKNRRRKVHPKNNLNKSYLNLVNKDRPLEETEIMKANALSKIHPSKKLSQINAKVETISKKNHPEASEIEIPVNPKHSQCKRKIKMKKLKPKKLEPTKSISLDGFLRKNDIPPENFIKNILSKINRNKTTVFDSLKNDAHIKHVIRKILKKELLPCRLIEKSETKATADLPLARNSQIKNMLEMGDKTLQSEFVSC